METLERVANQIAAQRNQALDAAAIAGVQRDEAKEALETAFKVLEQCIRSEWVPFDEVSPFIESVPGFAAWRSKQGAKPCVR